MLNSIDDDELLGFTIGSKESEYSITNGILMPETLNEIFFDVIEDLYPITYVNDEDLEDIDRIDSQKMLRVYDTWPKIA